MDEAGDTAVGSVGDAVGDAAAKTQNSVGQTGTAAPVSVDYATVAAMIEQAAKTTKAELSTIEERISGQIKRLDSIPPWWGFILICLAALAAGYYMFSAMLQYGSDREAQGMGRGLSMAELRALIEENARGIEALTAAVQQQADQRTTLVPAASSPDE